MIYVTGYGDREPLSIIEMKLTDTQRFWHSQLQQTINNFATANIPLDMEQIVNLAGENFAEILIRIPEEAQKQAIKDFVIVAMTYNQDIK